MALYPNAHAYLQAVYERYRTLEVYGDSGTSKSLDRKYPRVCNFETQYQRPGLFRFAFECPHPSPGRRYLFSKCVIGHDGTAPYFFSQYYSGPADIEQSESLEMAVAGATGISMGTAHTIGALLFADVGGFSLLHMKRIRFRRYRMIQGVPCVCVSGLHPRGGRYSAWFGAEDMLLRRLYRSKFNSEEIRTPTVAVHFEREAFLAPSVAT